MYHEKEAERNMLRELEVIYIQNFACRKSLLYFLTSLCFSSFLNASSEKGSVFEGEAENSNMQYTY